MYTYYIYILLLLFILYIYIWCVIFIKEFIKQISCQNPEVNILEPTTFVLHSAVAVVSCRRRWPRERGLPHHRLHDPVLVCSPDDEVCWKG